MTEFPFPVVMYHKLWDIVVLFTDEHCGTVIQGGEKSDFCWLGFYWEQWSSCYDGTIWDKYNGEVVISNARF